MALKFRRVHVAAGKLLRPSILVLVVACAARGEARLPLAFEFSPHATDAGPTVVARDLHGTVSFAPTETIFQLQRSSVCMRFLGASPSSVAEGLDLQAGRSNYFIGGDPSKWRRNVPRYSRVRYRGVYPGIDVVYYGREGSLEYDLVVAPGANPEKILLDFGGVSGVHLESSGDLLLLLGGEELRLARPKVYQEVDGARRMVAGSYVLKGGNRVGFRISSYDRRRPLVIDPVLGYSTYLGGSSDEVAYSVATDGTGDTYIAGYTSSSDFPATAGAYKTAAQGGSYDVFAAKFSSSGTLLYATYIGGSGDEQAYGIAVDSSGNAYVTGYTDSTNFPTTAGAMRATYRGGASDAFVVKLNAAGNGLVYSTYLGGSGDDVGYGVALGTSNEATVVGSTSSSDLPTSGGAYRTSNGGGITDAFVTRLNAAGTGLVYSTYLGGSGEDLGYAVALDHLGNAYLTGYTDSANFPTTAGVAQTTNAGGYDVFVTALNPNGTALIYSTFLGGSGEDYGLGIAVDTNGSAYVTGYTASPDYPQSVGVLQPAKGAGYDAVVTKLTSLGSISYSTFLGGNADDFGLAIAVDSAGHAFVTGDTASTDFPKTFDAIQTTTTGVFNAFVAQLNATGTGLKYSTYVGGSGFETGYGIAVDLDGAAYVTGYTVSLDFPITSAAAQATLAGGSDAFLMKVLACGYLLNSTSQPFGAAGGTGMVGFTTLNGCAWTAVSNAPWLSVTSGPSGSGSGTVNYTVASNAGSSPRSGTLTIAGQPFTVDESGISCTYTLTAGSAGYSAGANGGSVGVTTSAGCAWTATRNAPWLTITSGSPGTGNGTVNYTVESNTGAQRSGTLTIAGQTFTVNQAGLAGPAKVGTYNSGQWKLDANGNGVFDPGVDKSFNWGYPGTTRVQGDWNGDGKQKAGLYIDGVWYLDYKGDGVWDNGVVDKVYGFGMAGAQLVVGDWNGDGKDKIGIYINGFWFLDMNGNGVWDGEPTDKMIIWGWSGVTPVIGDWNGNGKKKVGLFYNGLWYLDYDGNGTWDGGTTDKVYGFGMAGVEPFVGDWNGDGKEEIGIYIGGFWFLDMNGNGVWDGETTDRMTILGWTGTTPVVGDWNGDGKTKVGTFLNGYWYLDYNGNGVWDGEGTDKAYVFGQAGDSPIVGRW